MTTALHAVESSGIGRLLRESLWAYPIVETMHIVGLGIVYGSVVIVDLRLLGLSRNISAKRLARHALPWTIGAFCVVALTGLTMFTAHAADFLGNRVFFLKMGLIMTAGLNAALLHANTWQGSAAWDTLAMPPARVRLQATLSIVVWTGVIACGRLLAYT